METYFASVDRSPPQEIVEQAKQFSKNPLTAGLLELSSGLLAILNEHRQVIALNHSLLDLLGIDQPEKVIGLRPGEMIKCIHAEDTEGGCGTSIHCSSCGAAIAIVTCMEMQVPVKRTCAITIEKSGRRRDIFFQIQAKPINIDGLRFILLFLEDITRQQQLEAMENVFLHDLSNIIVGINGLAELIYHQSDGQVREDALQLNRLSERLTQEINVQKYLIDDDNQFLSVTDEFYVSQVIEEIKRLFSSYRIKADLLFDVAADVPGMLLKSDFFLLTRVLINMTKNAIEASEEGGRVVFRVRRSAERVVFSVWNSGTIDESAINRIFQRNISTKKGSGRGLGTYSMKLFGEHYLGGRVYFSSTRQEGTTFFIDLPLS